MSLGGDFCPKKPTLQEWMSASDARAIKREIKRADKPAFVPRGTPVSQTPTVAYPIMDDRSLRTLPPSVQDQLTELYTQIAQIESMVASRVEDSDSGAPYDVITALTDNEPPIEILAYHADPTMTVLKRVTGSGSYFEVQSDPTSTTVAIRTPGELASLCLLMGAGDAFNLTVTGAIEGPLRDEKSQDGEVVDGLQTYLVTLPFRQIKKVFEAEVATQVVIDGITYKTSIKFMPATSRQTVSPYVSTSPYGRKEKIINVLPGEPLYVLGRGSKYLAIVDGEKQYVQHALVKYRGFERVLVTWDCDVYVGYFDETIDPSLIELHSLQLVRLAKP